MAQIHIQLLRGSNAGRTATFVQERLTFGRSAETTLMVDVPYASREHGEIALIDGRWVLINLSPNGTSISGKIYKDDQPHPLKSGDTIGVGKKNVMFSVAFDAPEVVPDNTWEMESENEIDTEAGAKRNSTRLWAGLAIFWAIVIVFAFVISSATKEEIVKPTEVVALSESQIAAMIREPLTGYEINTRAAAEALQEANKFFEQRQQLIDGHYRAHNLYKQSLAFSGKSGFDNDPSAQYQFNTVENELIDIVWDRYRLAWFEFDRNSYDLARERFKDLTSMYPNLRSPFHRHLELMWQRSQEAYQARRG